MPDRIRLSRAKGWRLPAGAVVVSRPSRWGNPWKAEVVDGVGWCCTDTRNRLTIRAATRAEVVGGTGWCCTDTRTGLTTQAADRAEAHRLAVENYRAWISASAADLAAARTELRGRALACWCPPDMPCHADVLIEVANAPEAAP